MGENELTNVGQEKSLFTVKRILRALSLLGIIFVFCPSFLVSCSGRNVNVSAMTAVGGFSAYGKRMVDPHPIMLICLLIPVAILVLMFIKKFTDNKTALITLICSIVDFVIWLIFRSSVKKIAEENYCLFKTTAWFVFNIIALILIIFLSVLVVLKKMQMDTDLINIFSGGCKQNALNQMSNAVTQISSAVSQMAGNVASNISNKTSKENAVGFCSKCGSPIAYGCNFCTSCGTPVPENVLAEAETTRKEVVEKAKLAEEEAKRREAERHAVEKEAAASRTESVAPTTQENNDTPLFFCQQCGAKLEPDAMFCESCGAKVE
jgi:uncharacterized OB-fold protein/uncharacterized membrane protein